MRLCIVAALAIQAVMVLPAFGQSEAEKQAEKQKEACELGRATLERNMDFFTENTREITRLLQLQIELLKRDASTNVIEELKYKIYLREVRKNDIATKQLMLLQDLDSVGCEGNKSRGALKELYMGSLARRQ